MSTWAARRGYLADFDVAGAIVAGGIVVQVTQVDLGFCGAGSVWHAVLLRSRAQQRLHLRCLAHLTPDTSI